VPQAANISLPILTQKIIQHAQAHWVMTVGFHTLGIAPAMHAEIVMLDLYSGLSLPSHTFVMCALPYLATCTDTPPTRRLIEGTQHVPPSYKNRMMWQWSSSIRPIVASV
jgi:hypothetical protein